MSDEFYCAMQFLPSELAQEETGTLLRNGDHVVWSPHDALEAAATLTQFLHEQTKSADAGLRKSTGRVILSA